MRARFGARGVRRGPALRGSPWPRSPSPRARGGFRVWWASGVRRAQGGQVSGDRVCGGAPGERRCADGAHAAGGRAEAAARLFGGGCPGAPRRGLWSRPPVLTRPDDRRGPVGRSSPGHRPRLRRTVAEPDAGACAADAEPAGGRLRFRAFRRAVPIPCAPCTAYICSRAWPYTRTPPRVDPGDSSRRISGMP